MRNPRPKTTVNCTTFQPCDSIAADRERRCHGDGVSSGYNGQTARTPSSPTHVGNADELGMILYGSLRCRVHSFSTSSLTRQTTASTNRALTGKNEKRLQSSFAFSLPVSISVIFVWNSLLGVVLVIVIAKLFFSSSGHS